MTSYLRLLFAAAIGAFCGVSYAATQSLESIQAAAEQHVLAQLPASKGKHFVTAQRIDLRLRLAECGEPLEAFMPNNAMPSTRTAVGVRCNAPAPWTIYVPVTVELEAPILVLRRALPRRSPVDVSDVELQTRRVPGIDASFISDTGNLRGRRLKRALADCGSRRPSRISDTPRNATPSRQGRTCIFLPRSRSRIALSTDQPAPRARHTEPACHRQTAAGHRRSVAGHAQLFPHRMVDRVEQHRREAEHGVDLFARGGRHRRRQGVIGPEDEPEAIDQHHRLAIAFTCHAVCFLPHRRAARRASAA